MAFNTWEEAAAGTLGTLEWEARTAAGIKELEPVEKFISAWVLRLQNGSDYANDLQQVVELIQYAGIHALKKFPDMGVQYSSNGMLDLLIRKQTDYGHDNINNFGVVGIAIRVCDKIARIRNMTSKGITGTAEPLQDAYADLVGYAVIATMYHHGSFQLPLQGDNNVR